MDKNPEKQFSHELMDIGSAEVAFVYEDTHTEIAEERYKLLLSYVQPGEVRVIDDIYTSADLIYWKKLEGVSWADGAEPLASIFYNEDVGTHTLIERSFWGIRCAGYKETKDFRTFTEFRHCLNVDSLDEDSSSLKIKMFSGRAVQS